MRFQVVDKYIFPHPREAEHRKLRKNKFSELVVRNAGDVGSGSAVAVIVHDPVVGGCSHRGEKGSVPSKMFVVLEKYLFIVQEGSCSHIEVQLATHPKRKVML